MNVHKIFIMYSSEERTKSVKSYTCTEWSS